MNRFLNSVRRRSASPGTPKKAATPSPKGGTTTQSPVTATTPATPSPAARTPGYYTGSTMSRRKKIPTHGPDGKPLKKSEIRRRVLDRRADEYFDMDASAHEDPRTFRKQTERKWHISAQQAVEQIMNRYANMGPEAIRAEFLKEVGDYRNPNTAHTWFDAYPDKNRNKDQITCLDENRVMLPSDKTKYINASWARVEKSDPTKKDTLLNSLGRKYILTQIPLESTMEEYWQMILELRAGTVLLLLSKQELEKVDKFWPVTLDEEKVYGCMTITCIQKYGIEGYPVRVLEVLHNKKNIQKLVWFSPCAVPALDRPHAAPIETLHCLLKLTSLVDHIDDDLDEEPCASRNVLIMDECGGTTRASLLLLVDAVCELIWEIRVDKPLQIADVFKFAIGCRGGAVLGEEEYLLAVQAVAEYIWRATDYYIPHYKNKEDFRKKSPEEQKEIQEQYKNKYAEQYKKIVGKAPGKKWRDKDDN